MTKPTTLFQPKSRKIVSFIFLFLCCFFALTAQHHSFNSPSIGARHASMGGTGVTENTIWASFHNQAGLGFIQNFKTGIYHTNRFGLQQLSTSALAIALPTRSATFGFSAQYFGYYNYNETKLGVGLGKKLGDGFSAGIQFDYVSRYVIEQYGAINHLVVEAGMIYEKNKSFRFGIHGYNPYPLLSKNYALYPLPRIAKAGIRYSPEATTALQLEYVLQSNTPGIFRIGGEYIIADKIGLRAGIVPGQRTYTFGVGYRIKILRIDLAFSNHQTLGMSPHFSMEYETN